MRNFKKKKKKLSVKGQNKKNKIGGLKFNFNEVIRVLVNFPHSIACPLVKR
jgi:hypothetical protein